MKRKTLTRPAVHVEQIGTATLYLADCRDVLEHTGHVNVIVADPPYGLGKRMLGGKWASTPAVKKQQEWDGDKLPLRLIESFLQHAEKVVIWGGNYYPLPPSRGWLIWDKENQLQTMADCEMAWTNVDMNTKLFKLFRQVKESDHPSEKPLSLMKWTLATIKASGRVLDPCMGSGTTGVAAIEMGLEFHGIEKDPAYFKVACERIRGAVNRGTLFRPDELPKRRITAASL